MVYNIRQIDEGGTMTKYKPVQLKPEQHKRLRLLAAMRGMSMAEVIYRGMDLLEAQAELLNGNPTTTTDDHVIYFQFKERET